MWLVDVIEQAQHGSGLKKQERSVGKSRLAKKWDDERTRQNYSSPSRPVFAEQSTSKPPEAGTGKPNGERRGQPQSEFIHTENAETGSDRPNMQRRLAMKSRPLVIGIDPVARMEHLLRKTCIGGFVVVPKRDGVIEKQQIERKKHTDKK